MRLAQLLHTLVLATAPRRILLGGGVMHAQPHLVRAHAIGSCSRSLNRITSRSPRSLVRRSLQYIGPPGSGALAGPLGALALAADALATRYDPRPPGKEQPIHGIDG
jgi:fructokinase